MAQGRRKSSSTGKVEMNFAEFPLGFLADRVPSGCTSFCVEDSIRFRGETIPRVLRILPSREYGFPVGKDRQIVKACVQLSFEAGFPEDGKIYFSRYHLIEALHWDHGGEQYSRVALGLDRLKVTNYRWENSWWDNATKEWGDHTFNIFDNLVIADSDRGKTKGGRGTKRKSSWFKWNDVVLESFKTGFLRTIDLDIYHSLKSLAAKEMYPLLMKNFYLKERLEYDLHHFAFQKLAMRGKSYEKNVAKVKDALFEPIQDLASHGVIKPLPRGKTFLQGSRKGEWIVVFEKGDGKKMNLPSPSPSKQKANDEEKVIQVLSKRGVSDKAAKKLARKFNFKQVRQAALAFGQQKRNGTPIPNPDGWFQTALAQGFETNAVRQQPMRADRRIFRATDNRGD